MVLSFNLSKDNHLKMWVFNTKTTASCIRQPSAATARAWGIPGWTVQPEKKQRRWWTSHRSLFSSFSPRQTQAGNLQGYQGLRQMIRFPVSPILVLCWALSGKHNWVKSSGVWIPAQTSPRAWSSYSNSAVVVRHSFPETTERPGAQVGGRNSFSTVGNTKVGSTLRWKKLTWQQGNTAFYAGHRAGQ